MIAGHRKANQKLYMISLTCGIYKRYSNGHRQTGGSESFILFFFNYGELDISETHLGREASVEKTPSAGACR